MKTKQTVVKEANAAKKDSKVNDSAEYVVFQNPNHNVLPDYHEVLRNNKNKNANALKINSNKRLAEEEEENIFNLGKPQVKSLERESAGNNYGSDEDKFRNENNEGGKNNKFFWFYYNKYSFLMLQQYIEYL